MATILDAGMLVSLYFMWSIPGTLRLNDRSWHKLVFTGEWREHEGVPHNKARNWTDIPQRSFLVPFITGKRLRGNVTPHFGVVT